MAPLAPGFVGYQQGTPANFEEQGIEESCQSVTAPCFGAGVHSAQASTGIHRRLSPLLTRNLQKRPKHRALMLWGPGDHQVDDRVAIRERQEG